MKNKDELWEERARIISALFASWKLSPEKIRQVEKEFEAAFVRQGDGDTPSTDSSGI